LSLVRVRPHVKSDALRIRELQVLRDIRDRVGVLPITPDEWEVVQPVTERLLKSGFTIKGLTENLWTNI